MRISDLKGKKIAVWGLGTEGVQAVRYLTAKEITDKIVLFNDGSGKAGMLPAV